MVVQRDDHKRPLVRRAFPYNRRREVSMFRVHREIAACPPARLCSPVLACPAPMVLRWPFSLCHSRVVLNSHVLHKAHLPSDAECTKNHVATPAPSRMHGLPRPPSRWSPRSTSSPTSPRHSSPRHLTCAVTTAAPFRLIECGHHIPHERQPHRETP